MNISFEAADDLFQSAGTLAEGLIRTIGTKLRRQGVDEGILTEWKTPVSESLPMMDLDEKITKWIITTCRKDIC